MRNDPAAAALVIMRSLKMHGMAQAVNELAQQGALAFEGAISVPSQLPKAETAEREFRERWPGTERAVLLSIRSIRVSTAPARQFRRHPGQGRVLAETIGGVRVLDLLSGMQLHPLRLAGC